MKQTVGIVLIIAALFLGYMGIDRVDDSGGSVNFLGIKISAKDEGARQTGYIFLGLAAISLIGGISLLRKR